MIANPSMFSPNWASTPGDSIRDLLLERKMGQSDLAMQMGTTTQQVNAIISGEVHITEQIAKSLHQVLGGTPRFWLQRDKLFHESKQRLNQSWLSNLPIKDMVKFGWITHEGDLLRECLNFFGVKTVRGWHEKYADVLGRVAFRTSLSFESNAAAVTAWLRQGEAISSGIAVKKWDKLKFQEELWTIRSLTRRKNPSDFLPNLISLCAECGVAVAIVRTPKGCPASGAAKLITTERAMIIVSFRYLTDDQFWFTFYHEAAHLILHSTNKLLIEEVGGNIDITNEEEEANSYAAEFLLPQQFANRLNTVKLQSREIIRLAVEAGISPGIVVGQLQHIGRLEYHRLNSLKRRYSVDELLN